MAGLSINSSPIDNLLHSPPDKRFTLVCCVFVSPSVFRICSICHTKFVFNSYFFFGKSAYTENNSIVLLWIFFPCRRLSFPISNGQQQSCTRLRSSFSKENLAVLRTPTVCGTFWIFVWLRLHQLGLLFHLSCHTVSIRRSIVLFRMWTLGISLL